MMFVYFVMTTSQAKAVTSIEAKKKCHTFSPRLKSCSTISGTMSTIGGPDMKTITLEIASRDKINRRFLHAFEGEPQETFISFESPELLFKVISGKRWDLLKVM